MIDVAVVGAGPAGLICAKELEKLGEKTIVVEKNKKIGDSVECAGLFNIDGLRRLDIDKGEYILNEVRGAKFIAANGDSAEMMGKASKAYVVDRGEFDRFLAKEYTGELVVGKEVKGARKKGENYELDFGKTVEAKSVVLATGNDNNLREQLGFHKPSRFISTSQYEIEGISTDKDMVELYVGSVAPGFFAWVIPVSDKVSRVGLGILDAKESTHNYMEAFLKRLKSEGKFKEKNNVLLKSGGVIPVFEPGLEVAHDNAYLVGDAATDMLAGQRVGCRLLFVLTGRGFQQLLPAVHAVDDFTITRSLAGATTRIINAEMEKLIPVYSGRSQHSLSTVGSG